MNYLFNAANVAVLLGSHLVLSGCTTDIITVPSSDNSPPVAGMSVDFTTKEGNRATVDITTGSTSNIIELDPTEPIALLAFGQDTDGGVRRISVSGSYNVSCLGSTPPSNTSIFESNFSNVSPGGLASTRLLQDWVFNPQENTSCSFAFEEITGSIIAIAENFHNGTDMTQSFAFTMCQSEFQGTIFPCE